MIIFGKECRDLPLDIKYFCYSDIIPPYQGFKTDCSWGCCLRNMQSVLGNFFYRHTFPLDILENGELSIHNIVRACDWYGGKVGTYYAQSVCRALVDISLNFKDFSVMCIDSKTKITEPLTYPVLLFCPVRFGLDTIEERYINSIDALLCHPHSLGFIGGKGSSSYYVIGKNGHKLVYLDPHDYRSSNMASKFSLPSSGVNVYYNIQDLNPSITFCFDISNEKELDEILFALEACNDAMLSCMESPIISPIMFHDDEDNGFCVVDGNDDETW